jgi:cyclic pyranopterin phosphate synthase
MTMQDFTHFDQAGRARMVDVAAKEATGRSATAQGRIALSRETYQAVLAGTLKKGDVLGTAQIAGILAAKKTPELIPMCHPLLITGIDMDFTPDEETSSIAITATVRCTGQTGVEMEALTAVSVAALTIYDMCKALQKDMVIGPVRLLEKSGGKSGTYRLDEVDSSPEASREDE